jgi:predicted ATPase with chaperone activity
LQVLAHRHYGAVAPSLRRGRFMLAAICSASVLGVTGQPVTVEVHVGPGLPSFQIVGLPDEACRESRDRVRAAVLSTGLDWPNKRITVNLAPSGLRKGGSGLDLAIAVGVLVADERLDARRVQTHSIIGELGLDGSLRPGEVSLAHGGVLFLDELGEFSPSVLDALRQPLEEGVIRVSRAHCSATLPARFLLVAATNPCPCGGGPPGSCECDEAARQRYLRRLSGPLLDRFDLRVGVRRTEIDDLLGVGGGETTAVVRERVDAARARSLDRGGCLNAALAPADLDRVAPLAAEATALLRTELERGRLTGRGLHRVRRVARTIADLAGDDGELVRAEHVALALQLRVRLRVSARSDAA